MALHTGTHDGDLGAGGVHADIVEVCTFLQHTHGQLGFAFGTGKADILLAVAAGGLQNDVHVDVLLCQQTEDPKAHARLIGNVENRDNGNIGVLGDTLDQHTFHVFYNLLRCIAMVPFAGPMAKLCQRMIRDEPELDNQLKPKHLDPSALDTPALALANAARETLRIGDAMEQMLGSLHKVMHGEPRQEKELRRMADDINVLYTAIKLYLARMPKDELAEEESRRWAEIIEMSLNLEQASDIVERMGSEIADKSLAARRAFSVEGLKELDALYDLLLSNLQLAMSVFFSSDVPSARRLRRSKHRFRILNRRYSHAHVDRLHQQNVQSIETSTLHLALLGDMKRLNSLFCSVAYSVMEQPDEDDERDDY